MDDDKKNLEARLIYQIYTEDIRHAKNQLWKMIYYGLLLQAAIFTISQIEKLYLSKYMLEAVLWTATTLVIILMVIYYYILQRFREKKDKVYKEFFEEDIRKILEPQNTCADKFLGECSERVFLFVFISILIIGAHIVSKTI